REALRRDEAGHHEADVHAVLLLLRVQTVAPADQRELARGVGRGPRAGDTRPATLATLTIELGAERRRIGSSASVSRSVASKFSFMWRSTPVQPCSAKLPRQAAPALFTSRSSRPCSDSTASATRLGAFSSVRSTAT